MDAAGLRNTAQVFRSVLPIRPSASKDPGVRTWCIYSNISTPIGYKYDFDFKGDQSAKQPSGFVYGDGDGTVHLASLNICDRWTIRPTDLGIRLYKYFLTRNSIFQIPGGN